MCPILFLVLERQPKYDDLLNISNLNAINVDVELESEDMMMEKCKFVKEYSIIF